MKEASHLTKDAMSSPGTEKDSEVVRAARVVEWLKAELVGGTANTLRGIAQGHEEVIVEGLSDTIIHTYLLGRRLGISPTRLDLRIINKLDVHIKHEHQLEKWYGDLSVIAEHMSGREGREPV